MEDGEQAICELDALNSRLLEFAHVGRFFFFFRPSGVHGSHAAAKLYIHLSRMNKRIAFAMTIWECKPWSWQIFSKQFRVATKIFDQQNSWAAATSTWTPTNEWQQIFSTEPKRRQGRPSKRWDDNVEKFAMNYFRMSWATAARIRPEWQFFDQVYLQFCM